MSVYGVADWAEVASALNATISVTRPAEPGKNHYITSISGSFTVPPTSGIRLDLREDGVNKYSLFIAEYAHLIFVRPYELPAGKAASLVLGAGGIGATGAVTLQGYTV